MIRARPRAAPAAADTTRAASVAAHTAHAAPAAARACLDATRLAAGSLAALVLLAGTMPPAGASGDAFRLDVTPARLAVGREEALQVRLLEDPGGKPLADAVIFRTRLDMSPDAMGEMVAPLKSLPSSEPGVWRFATRLSMAGRWLLTVQAKVPGRMGTVREEIVITGFEPAAVGGAGGASGGGAPGGGAHGH